jgi:hypothetical protein
VISGKQNLVLVIVCRDFYGIDSLLSPTCLLTRCKEGKKKNIYFTSPAVRDIVINNCHTIKVNQHVSVKLYLISECFFLILPRKVKICCKVGEVKFSNDHRHMEG